jgi:hypothetical protein
MPRITSSRKKVHQKEPFYKPRFTRFQRLGYILAAMGGDLNRALLGCKSERERREFTEGFDAFEKEGAPTTDTKPAKRPSQFNHQLTP